MKKQPPLVQGRLAGRESSQTRGGQDDAGFENSGDEAVIQKGKKRAKKTKAKEDGYEEDEGGEGGLIRRDANGHWSTCTELLSTEGEFLG